jgi:hypothetical protein
MFRRAAPLLALLLFASPVRSAPVDSLGATEILRANAQPLTLENGELRGPGADSLWSEAKRSRFVMVGEDHGFAEVPHFCAALFRGLHRAGYGHVAIEVGPITARTAATLAASAHPVEAFRAFDKSHPWGIPFLFWQEEAEWVTDALHTAGGGGEVLWGLDQEFIESPQFLLERLGALARTPRAKALAESCLAAAREGNRLLMRGNPAASWLVSAEEPTWQRLAAAFPAGEAGRIVSELRQSRAVYQPVFRGDGYSNNLDRSQLMKRHLEEYLAARRAAGEKAPRVLFKFGGSHTMRGRTIVNVYDMGSAVHELAELEGSRAFGLYIQGASGTQNAYRPFGSTPPDTAKAIDPAGSDLYFASDLAGSMPGDTTWRLVDLRPLRRALAKSGSKGVPAALEKLAWSYDAALLVPVMHASRFLNSPFSR